MNLRRGKLHNRTAKENTTKNNLRAQFLADSFPVAEFGFFAIVTAGVEASETVVGGRVATVTLVFDAIVATVSLTLGLPPAVVVVAAAPPKTFPTLLQNPSKGVIIERLCGAAVDK